MLILFETIKIVFFLLTIFLATIMLKGEIFMSSQALAVLHKILFPAYVVLIGILIGYIGALLLEDSSTSPETRSLLYTRMFIIGIVLGLVFALGYIFIV